MTAQGNALGTIPQIMAGRGFGHAPSGHEMNGMKSPRALPWAVISQAFSRQFANAELICPLATSRNLFLGLGAEIQLGRLVKFFWGWLLGFCNFL
jgi:hypothetical protein